MDRDLELLIWIDDNATPARCIDSCLNSGYGFAGVQVGIWSLACFERETLAGIQSYSTKHFVSHRLASSVFVAITKPGGMMSQQNAPRPALEMLTRYVADITLTQSTGRVSIKPDVFGCFFRLGGRN